MRSLAEQAAIDVVFWMILGTMVFIALVEVVGRLMNRSVPQVDRLNRRIPRYEMELVGDDYRKHVVEFAQKVERRRAIVRKVSGVGN